MDEIDKRKVENQMMQEDLQRAKEEALQKKREVCLRGSSLFIPVLPFFTFPPPPPPLLHLFCITSFLCNHFPSFLFFFQAAAALAAQQKVFQEQKEQKLKEEQMQNKATAEEIKVSRQAAVDAKQKLKTQNRKYGMRRGEGEGEHGWT